MKQLWTPWREAYVKKLDSLTGCFLCRALKSRSDSSNLIVRRSKLCFCILNKYPYNAGHVLISPNRHVGDISKMRQSELIEVMELTVLMKDILSRTLSPHGFNIGINQGRAAGAGLVGHAHVHLIPRWTGDTNFMPVMSGAKTISQTLRAMHKLLVSGFEGKA